MISARRLAEEHGSFWELLAPNLPRLVRSLNLSGRDVFAPPMNSRVSPDRLYFINEVGFELYFRSAQGRSRSISEIVNEVARRFSVDPKIEKTAIVLSSAEIEDANELAARLRIGIPSYISTSHALIEDIDRFDPTKTYEEKIIPKRPRFNGVGLLDVCEGDLRFSNNLVEVKSGERNLRSSDFRQILTYFALSVLSESDPIDACLLLNPRQGYRIDLDFGELIPAISGRSTVEFVAIFRDYLVDWKECD